MDLFFSRKSVLNFSNNLSAAADAWTLVQHQPAAAEDAEEEMVLAGCYSVFWVLNLAVPQMHGAGKVSI